MLLLLLLLSVMIRGMVFTSVWYTRNVGGPLRALAYNTKACVFTISDDRRFLRHRARNNEYETPVG